MAKKVRINRVFNVLGCCGSGTVTSAMLGSRITDILDEMGIRANVTTVVPQQVKQFVERKKIDFIVTSCIISDKVDVPIIRGMALISGVGEEECIEQIKTIVTDVLKKEGLA